MYSALKTIHIACVIASGAGFLLRGALMLADSPLAATRFARVAPHLIDTMLLAAGVTMAVIAHISPLAHPWLATKIGALVAYVVLGSIALKRGRTRAIRGVAFAAAVGTYAYIVGVALTRSPALGL
ncbi:regulator SirB [Betaproteobacteria bacterium PRO7]|nr:SirB2 family protein [Burkholderiaceae bacterium]MDL1863332.1 regulator SirB [Betaproteobacteria bacterium PRO7]